MMTSSDRPAVGESPCKSLVTAGAVIHAMRRIEARVTDSGQRRGSVMEECRSVLSAASIALYHIRNDGDLSLVALAGDPPDGAMVNDALTRASRRSRQWFSFIHRTSLGDMVLAGRGSDVVCVTLRAGGEAWVEDFVAFVAERLIRAGSKVHDSDGDSVSAFSLVLPPGMIVGPSAAMRQMLEQMAPTVSSRLDVLLSGETGTGKELLARVVHDSGPTRGGPFVAVNCAAIPGELLEAELFGVERHVATGVDPRKGLFTEADGGSMFLDEVAELPERLQAKLLRVIQEREVLAVGAKRPRSISVRVISACNRDLMSLVSAGQFRADLYYRLRGLEFHAPPLRERKEDIPALALEFLTRAAGEYGKSIAGITNAALELLRAYAWPGNVRELQSEIRRVALLCGNGSSIDDRHFPSLKIATFGDRFDTTRQIAEASVPATLRERLDSVERLEIERALIASRGNHSAAARMLGITRNGLTGKLRRLGLEASQ